MGLIAVPEKPSSKWSFGNQLLLLLAGTADARGYRQWQDVGRHVRRGSRAFYILVPVLVERPLDESAEGKDETVKVLVGFRTIPVFRCEDARHPAPYLHAKRSSPAPRCSREVRPRDLCS